MVLQCAQQWQILIWRLGLEEWYNAALCTLLLDLTSGSGLDIGAQMIPSNYNYKLN